MGQLYIVFKKIYITPYLKIIYVIYITIIAIKSEFYKKEQDDIMGLIIQFNNFQ